MILGYGVEWSGFMNRLIRPIMNASGSSETRLIGLVSAVVGANSPFMQNIGAAALFLPAMMRISRISEIMTLLFIVIAVGFFYFFYLRDQFLGKHGGI